MPKRKGAVLREGVSGEDGDGDNKECKADGEAKDRLEANGISDVAAELPFHAGLFPSSQVKPPQRMIH